MKKISITFIAFLCLIVPIIFAQELDDAFLDSLPEGVKEDVLDKVNIKKDQIDSPVYRSASSKVDKDKLEQEELERNIEEILRRVEKELKKDDKPKIFGEEFFDTIQTSFMPINEPNLDSSYVLDFGDVLEIQLIGQNDSISSYTVSRDGSINLPDIGKVSLSGLSLDDASSLIKAKVSNAFIGTEAYISLKNVRDISILIAGNAFNPGIYTLNGNSNILHALSMAGGLSDIGSYRKIDHIRNGNIVQSLDLYDVLINGNYKQSSGLRSGDSIVVNSVGATVSVESGFTRRAIFELKNNETFQDIFQYAAGFSKNSDLDNIIVKRIDKGKSDVINLTLEELRKFKFKDSDAIFIREYKINTINMIGAVINPGTYKFAEGTTLSEAIITAGGYSDSAYPFGGYLENKDALRINNESKERLYDSFIDNLVSNASVGGGESSNIGLLLDQIKNAKSTGRLIAEFDLDLIANDSSLDTLISDGDIIIIPNITQQVFIQGKVSNPGAIRYSPGKDLNYYIKKAGGTLDSSDLDNIFVVYPNGETINLSNNARLTSIFSDNENLLLYPGSIIYIPQSTDFTTSLQAASIWAPIISSVALSLTSLSVLNNN